MKSFFVYILSNASRTLYIGVTSNLEARIDAHKRKVHEGFTREFNITMLVYFEELSSANEAIAREKQLKNWTRAKKVRLIEGVNPSWRDLAADWLTGRSDD